jgi:hypothetical protein
MILKMQRNGRIWKNAANGHEEELFDVIVDGKKIHRGVCGKYFERVSGVKFKKGETKIFELKLILE